MPDPKASCIGGLAEGGVEGGGYPTVTLDTRLADHGVRAALSPPTASASRLAEQRHRSPRRSSRVPRRRRCRALLAEWFEVLGPPPVDAIGSLPGSNRPATGLQLGREPLHQHPSTRQAPAAPRNTATPPQPGHTPHSRLGAPLGPVRGSTWPREGLTMCRSPAH